VIHSLLTRFFNAFVLSILEIELQICLHFTKSSNNGHHINTNIF